VIGQDDACFIETTSGGNSWNFPSVFPNYTGLLAFSSFQTVAFDPTCDNTVYVGVETQATAPQSNCLNDQPSTHDLYQSTDNGVSYTKIHSFTSPLTNIATVKIDPNTIWVGLDDGTLQFTTNALSGVTSTWQAPATQPAAIAGQPVTGIAIDPTNTQDVVVVYPGFSGVNPDLAPTQHVFMTTDGGATWTDISGVINGGATNLPDLPLHSVVIDPGTSPHTIVVASDAGVLQSADLGKTWQVLGIGMPTVEVTSLALDSAANPPLLRAGTYGRSVFELGAATTGLLAVNANLSFAQVCSGSSPTQIITLYNVGPADLHVSSLARVSGSTDFTIISGPSLPVTISPDSSVSFTIGFTPTGTGAESAVFQINSDDPFTPMKQLSATATVATPQIATVIASGGNFGDTCLGSFTDLNLTVSNSGQCPLKVTAITSPDPEFETATTMSYPLTIAAGAALAVPLRFQPATLGGPKSTIISVASNDPLNPVASVSVNGNAPSGTVAVTGNTAFGDVCAPSNPTQALAVNNVGKCNLNITSAAVTCADFTLVNNPFPATVSPDSHVDETVKWTPTSGGAKSCNLVLHTDDPANPIVTVALSGDTPPVNLSVPPAGLMFPPTVVQNSGNCQATLGTPITNSGKCGVQVNSAALSGASANQYSLTGLSALPVTLPAGGQLGSGDMEAIFKPNLPLARTDTASLDVTYVSDPITSATSLVSVPMCGEATYRGLRVLVTQGGVPVATVKRIKLWAVISKDEDEPRILLQNQKNLALQSVTGAAPCPSFQFQAEYGTVAHPIQLKPGNYLLQVTIKVGKKKQRKLVKLNLGTCDFDQQITVAF
jgi:Abnormal spindle-like microcephaly-assoc'd, ASPM-SPD-2-Hydin